MDAKSEEIKKFVVESNRIEGILRRPKAAEIRVTTDFLRLPRIGVADLENFVQVCAQAPLRRNFGMNVRVGKHLPPPGGPNVGYDLDMLLQRANDEEDPYAVHVDYETLHPFMDGNGRSGRVLWAWQMLAQGIWPGLKLGFLHAFYYQTLSASRSMMLEKTSK